jgi:hypothetical protein
MRVCWLFVFVIVAYLDSPPSAEWGGSVVLLSPVLDHDLRLGDRAELLDVQQLVTSLPLNDSTNGFSHGDPGSM